MLTARTSMQGQTARIRLITLYHSAEAIELFLFIPQFVS